MPLSKSKFNVGQKRIRYYFAKHFVDSIGKNVNVRKSAFIQKYVIISEQKKYRLRRSFSVMMYG